MINILYLRRGSATFATSGVIKFSENYQMGRSNSRLNQDQRGLIQLYMCFFNEPEKQTWSCPPKIDMKIFMVKHIWVYPHSTRNHAQFLGHLMGISLRHPHYVIFRKRANVGKQQLLSVTRGVRQLQFKMTRGA